MCFREFNQLYKFQPLLVDLFPRRLQISVHTAHNVHANLSFNQTPTKVSQDVGRLRKLHIMQIALQIAMHNLVSFADEYLNFILRYLFATFVETC